jgi:hypothetical protein
MDHLQPMKHVKRLVWIGLVLLLSVEGCASGKTPSVQLTGTWRADDQAYYYIRQVGASVWWAGLGGDHGLSYTNVFRGTIQPQNTNIIIGTWTDVPRGTNLLSGMLTLNILQSSNGIELRKQSQTGGFSPSVWTKVSNLFNLSPDIEQPDCNINCRLDSVLRRNTDGNMHDHLKVYKDNVSIYGTILGPPNGNWPANLERTYNNFECGPDIGGDGDISFDVAYDFGSPTPPDFWTGGNWLNNTDDIHNKLRYEFRNNGTPHVHAEIIMYGKKYSYLYPVPGTSTSLEIPDCSGNTPILLPGWMETGRNSVLLNGRPINGQTGLLGQRLTQGASVRVRGFMALDCHGPNDPEDVLEGVVSRECYPTDADVPNVEVHPVYAIDVIQDFGHSRSPHANLTGVWGGNNVDATYYVRQLGDRVWWLGLSSDDGLNDGLTFATVFQGRIQGNNVVGDWADIPLGMRQQSGTSSTGTGSFCANGSCTGVGPVEQWNNFSFPTWLNQGWQGPDLRKLYDVISGCFPPSC